MANSPCAAKVQTLAGCVKMNAAQVSLKSGRKPEREEGPGVPSKKVIVRLMRSMDSAAPPTEWLCVAPQLTTNSEPLTCSE